MCGISGIVGFDPKDNISEMIRIAGHRGPDNFGVWREEGISLGHARLSIVDTSERGNQPMQSFCGRYHITFNGEIYNFKELKKKLLSLGVPFNSDSDTEVVVNLFSVFGKASVTMLRGMFAFGIWDNVNKTLFIARDHLGIKPLLYFMNGFDFVFASELKSIVASGKVPLEYNHESIISFLSQGHVLQPNTILQNVFSLLPGSYGTYSCGKLTTDVFWNYPNLAETNLNISYEEALTQTKDLVVDSVKEELNSDVPVGLFLSGGLDSSVLASACKHIGHGGIKTFSIGFGDEGSSMDESSMAREMSEFIGSEHHSYKIGYSDLLDNFDKFISSLDQPSIDGLNNFFVSQKAKEHVTVALSGLGGDEVFSGYGWVKSLLNDTWENPRLFELYIRNRNLIPACLKGRSDVLFSKMNLSGSYLLSNSVFFPSEIEKLLYRTTKEKSNIFEILLKFNEHFAFGKSKLNNISALDSFNFMTSRLLRDSDCTAMAHSLEVRFPLIDYRIVELVMSLPPEYRIDKNYLNSNGVYEDDFSFEKHRIKKLLYDAFSSDLPQNFGARKKSGFKLPMGNWFRNELKPYILDQCNASSMFFEKSDIDRVLLNFETGKGSWVQLWSIIILNSIDKRLRKIKLESN